MNYDALMDEAIALALRGRGQVEPNPRVGALALRDGQIVGRGWHRAWGGLHAEPEALRDAAENGVNPDSVVVTLEPCSSKGTGKKQPPCVEWLLEAGIERVVVGATDPDPRHVGGGLEQLRQAGVEVITGVRADACHAINRAFDRWLSLARPWTIAKWAMTLDGKIAAASGDSQWISSAESRRRVHELRARVDAVVVGFRTAQRDDPRLTVRDAEGANPIRIVVDPRGELSPDRGVVQSAGEVPTWLLVREDAECDALEATEAEIVRCPTVDDTLDVAAAWAALRELGLRRVLVEGGGALFARLYESDCVDQVLAFVTSRLVGGREAPTPFDGRGSATIESAFRLDEWWWDAPAGDGAGEDLVVHGVFH